MSERIVTGRIPSFGAPRFTKKTEDINGQQQNVYYCTFKVIDKESPRSEPITITTRNQKITEYLHVGRLVKVSGRAYENPNAKTDKNGQLLKYANPHIAAREIIPLDLPIAKQVITVMNIARDRELADEIMLNELQDKLISAAQEILIAGQYHNEVRETVSTRPQNPEEDPL